MHEDPSQRQLTFSLIQSAFMKEFVGSWHVQPAADGGLTEVSGRDWGMRAAALPAAVVVDVWAAGTCSPWQVAAELTCHVAEEMGCRPALVVAALHPQSLTCLAQKQLMVRVVRKAWRLTAPLRCASSPAGAAPAVCAAQPCAAAEDWGHYEEGV